ncbi:hypothetical protein IVB36_00150 [Bradyrhizobium sp. 35]|nr:hypothetical protein [Bradyrhizobium sp. 35]
MEKLVSNIIERLLLDKTYRGHNAAPDYKFRVLISGQKRGVTPSIIENVIGHLKAEHLMERKYLWFTHGDANNAVLAASATTSAVSSAGPGVCWHQAPGRTLRPAAPQSDPKRGIFTVD